MKTPAKKATKAAAKAPVKVAAPSKKVSPKPPVKAQASSSKAKATSAKAKAAPAKAKARRDSMRQKQTRHRSEKPLEQWTVKDVAQEFHAEMNKHLPMMSWNMYQSRFIMALADFRAANDSDARLELQIMRMFWANPYHWETCDGPEQIWKRFIKLAPGVIPWANRIVNKVPVSVQNEILDKQWEEFYAEYGNVFEETPIETT